MLNSLDFYRNPPESGNLQCRPGVSRIRFAPNLRAGEKDRSQPNRHDIDLNGREFDRLLDLGFRISGIGFRGVSFLVSGIFLVLVMQFRRARRCHTNGREPKRLL